MTYLTIKEIADSWKEEKRPYVKRSTFATYMLTLENHLLPYFGSMTELSDRTVQSFVLEKLNGGLSVKTIKDILIVLKMIMKHGVKNKWTNHVEWDIKYPTSTTPAGIEVLTIANHKKILDYVRENFSFKALCIYLCLTTGMRIGEICALRWKDINVLNGTLHVKRTIERIYIIDDERKYTELIINEPKTPNSVREIPLSSEALKVIKPLMKVVNTGYYVISNDSKPIEPRTYRSYYKRLLMTLKIPAIKFHGLRHPFATRCIESNCDYKTVSVLLGHSDISTTLNLYVHPNMEQKKRCITKMVKSLGKS
ncbi:MAG: site-specific integrase [Muribaculaceae bacterium]|nr:site-specific integrase [Muribaculaceae bacterium]